MNRCKLSSVYNVASGGGLLKVFVDTASDRARQRIFALISRTFPIDDVATILDVGVTADREFESSNFFEKFYKHPERITAISDQDATWMEGAYTGLRFVRGDALALPFQDASFDLVFSSAVLEHVGNRQNQKRMIEEACRVARRYVCITTPNRWHPIEFHTFLPFIHWFPKEIHRKILRFIGLHDHADESKLNLCSTADITAMCSEVVPKSFFVAYVNFLFVKSNIIIFIDKSSGL